MKRNYAAICLACTLVACGQSTPSTTAQAESSASAPARTIAEAVDKAKATYDKAFIAGFRKAFVEDGIKSCMQSSGRGEQARQLCECGMNTLNESLTDDEIFAMSKNNDPKDLDQRMENAAAACVKQLENS